MPMDPKEFQQRVTEHFKNVTEEKFLNNLRKSSPYLFIENPEERDRVLAERYSQPSYRQAYYDECDSVSQIIDCSDPKHIDNDIAVEKQGAESPDFEPDEKWLKKNATPELGEKIYNYLSDSEKKELLALLLQDSTTIAV
jgi:hypothetical protein